MQTLIECLFFAVWQGLAMYGFCHLIWPLVSEYDDIGERP